jgi:hypothetical protein
MDYTNDRLKKEIIKTLMTSKYKNNIDDRDKIEEGLQFMSFTQLDKMLSEYYFFEIRKINNET